MKENNLWPEINLTASLAQNGIADHFPAAVQQISDEDNMDLLTGITITFPFANTKAKSELEEAKLEKAKMLLTLKLLERKITIEIVDQVRTCNVFKQTAINIR